MFFKNLFIKIIEDPEVQQAACKIVKEVVEQLFVAAASYVENSLIKAGFKAIFSVIVNVSTI